MREIEAGNNVENFPVNKPRPIKYASHQDSQIFSYYRFILAERYEELLKKKGLSDFPTAYRKIPVKPGSAKGKCNIHFAKEAFDEIVRQGDCVALTFDISCFFESLDHAFLEKKWCEVMGFLEMPKDHMAVFKAVTNYSLVDKNSCYENLGLIRRTGKKKILLHCPFHIFRKRKMLCNKAEYREKIVAKSLVKKNDYRGLAIPQGVPQGSPISDILANIYMLDFDEEMAALANKLGAYYRRYSDDILWVCHKSCVEEIKHYCSEAIQRQGHSTLSINDKKTTETHFHRTEKGLACSGDHFSYLGFSFDGKKAMYRDKTISGYRRDVVFSIHSFLKCAYVKGKGNGLSLKDNLNISQIFHKIGFPNKNYVSKQRENDEWADANFMTYHMRALRIFNNQPDVPYKLSDQQLAGYKNFIGKKIVEIARKFDSTFII